MFAILADNQSLVREAIAGLLAKEFHFNVLQAIDADVAVTLTQKHNPVLVCMELMMPGLDTFEAATQIRKMAPHTKVVIMTGRSEVDLVARARSLKIHGYILKGDSLEESQYAINTILRGGVYIPPSLSQQLYDPERDGQSALDRLTPKECAMLSLIAQGMTMKEAAGHMSISPKTAETHRNNLGRKLGHPNRAQLFAFALKHRLIDSKALAIPA